MDAIAELLSQLSGVRCSAGRPLNSPGPGASQLQLQLRTNTGSPLQSHHPQQQPAQLTQKAVSTLSRIPNFL